jgi:glutaredoxin 3
MKVEIYSKNTCSFCNRAKEFFSERGINYNEHLLGRDFTRDYILKHFPRSKTYPIIIIDGMNIGGYEELSKHIDLFSGTLSYLSEGG